MEDNKCTKSDKLSFYSDEMFIPRKSLIENHLKLTYQRQLISNLESKHKEWSKHFGY